MSDTGIKIGNLLKQYERACAAVVEQGDSNLSATAKERAFDRNEGRERERLADAAIHARPDRRGP